MCPFSFSQNKHICSSWGHGPKWIHLVYKQKIKSSFMHSRVWSCGWKCPWPSVLPLWLASCTESKNYPVFCFASLNKSQYIIRIVYVYGIISFFFNGAGEIVQCSNIAFHYIEDLQTCSHKSWNANHRPAGLLWCLEVWVQFWWGEIQKNNHGFGGMKTETIAKKDRLWSASVCLLSQKAYDFIVQPLQYVFWIHIVPIIIHPNPPH